MSMISKQIDDLRAYAKDRKGELAKLINDAAFTNHNSVEATPIHGRFCFHP